MKVNLLVSAILIAVYALPGGVLLAFPNTYVLLLVLVFCVTILPGFRSLLIQYSIFPAIKRLIIDPYYEQNPHADKQARLDLGLEVEEEPVPADTDADKPDEEEVIFTDTLPAKEEAPKKALPKQYNEKELRRFNRQVQSNRDEDDDDTI